ncbi:MAG: hypothetical protein A2600_13405 [Candidatus Lambdaproteobacteria bacterium RIFOXYD1_FULL_56_27]|uniref:DUF2642 domain-containing protein n=1 Tax=Candidatus Lambdaproteobacteria bacterium RIFOXYD2_FULL_56_26 TaxID=1817773 RepID=A0A1F6H1F4_9PROT|nr:MAG: hypothetical protein A2426_07285 [Candidatus Lambdaproteobacteria bacterium RIFOXYC1_FULL_56_13]OGH04172.1 MAG: hypothetical protein A2557_00070 [Candidatus Lambdaproteobacteria bacterium RIFOXYD2_FULL_56_26]OGH08306.1 MAG: hypothetical protein A2600_13405 [Candidatus Lambdaproteobacteria bacterium RIFOXYD1_FULL_56_27]
MSPLIHTVSHSAEAQKSLGERLAASVGVTSYQIVLVGGGEVRGVLEEVGSDYLVTLTQTEEVRLIPFSSVLYLKVLHP